MTTKKKIFWALLIFFILLFIVTIITALFSTPNSLEKTIPVISPQPTISSSSMIPNINSSPLILESILPESDPNGNKNYAPMKPITFTFNKELSPGKIKIEVFPPHEISVIYGDKPNQIIIAPENPLYWEPDILYTIKILKGTTAIDGSVLQKDINYQLKTKTPIAGE